MAGAEHLLQADGLYQVQAISDFELEIQGIPGADTINLAMQSMAMASERSEEVQLGYLNEYRYMAGKTSYDTIPIVIRDMVDVEVRNHLKNWRRLVHNPGPDAFTLGGVTIPAGANGLAKNYKKQCNVLLYAPDRSTYRVQELNGAFPLEVEGGALDHGASGHVEVTVTLRFDSVTDLFIPTAG